MRRAGVDVQVQDCVHPEGEGPPGRPGPGCKVWLRDSRHPPRVWSNVEPGLRTAAERVDGVNTYRANWSKPLTTNRRSSHSLALPWCVLLASLAPRDRTRGGRTAFSSKGEQHDLPGPTIQTRLCRCAWRCSVRLRRKRRRGQRRRPAPERHLDEL